MAVVLDELVEELKALRKGRGILAPGIAGRIGPALREVCGVTVEADAVRLRAAVTQRLRELAEHLPSDLRICVIAAFALDPEVSLPFYQDRVHWAATRLDRDDRTARRRIDQGIVQLAEQATAGAPGNAAADRPQGTGWHTESLRVALSVTQDQAEAYEFRRVIAERDGLTDLDLAWTVTADPGKRVPLAADELPIDVLYGGQLVGRKLQAADRVGLMLHLATPLDRGEVHEIALRYRAPNDREMRPHYVCTPVHPCDHFELRVRFPSTWRPDYVWLLDGVLQGDIEDQVAPRKLVPIDSAGEVKVEFRRLIMNRSYGIRWEFAPS